MNNGLISRAPLMAVPNVRKVTEYDEAGYSISYNAVPVEVIENAPSVDVVPKDFHERCLQLEIQKRFAAEKAAPKWISVDDKLPEDDARYLCYTIDALCEVCIYYGDGEWIAPDFANWTRYVTHWMPLPEPPEELKEESE